MVIPTRFCILMVAMLATQCVIPANADEESTTKRGAGRKEATETTQKYHYKRKFYGRRDYYRRPFYRRRFYYSPDNYFRHRRIDPSSSWGFCKPDC